MVHLAELEALGKSLTAKIPWNEGDVDNCVSFLRQLRGKFGSGKEGISQEVCAHTLSVLTSILDKLLTTPMCLDFLDQTDGRDHLVLSIVLQCLVNGHSYMKTHDMPISGEITATITNTLLYNPDICIWVYSLKSTTPLPLWRARIGYSAFVLITELIIAALQSGIHPDFTRFLDHAAQCMRTIVVYGGENVQLMQNWYEHTILLISALCNATPREAYWQQASKRPEHIVQLSSALGTILLLHSYENGLKEIDTPSMVKLAELCMKFCGPLINRSSETWIKNVMCILKHCIYELPFKIRREQDYAKKECNPIAKQLPDDNLPRMLGILRGAVHLILHLLPPLCDPPKTNWSTLDDEGLSELIFTIGDMMVLVDSLLQAHLSKQEPIGPRKKAPSLMSSMGAFSYEDPRSIAFAVFLKQELIRSLLSVIYYRPHMVPYFEKHIRVASIECLDSNVPVNAPDMFWALVNFSQRDPSGVAAVEYTIVLLNRILKPELHTEEVLKASSILAKRMAELKPVATLREQFPSNLFGILGSVPAARRLYSSLEVIEFSSSRILDPKQMERLIAKPLKAALFDKFLKVYPDFDGMIVKPLQDVAKMDPPSIINLLKVALSSDLLSTSGNFCNLETRLQIIQPDFVVTQVMNPLMRFGVANPQRIIRRCPSLFVAAAMRDRDQSRLLEALSTLNALLTRKELASVVKKFPSVLTRSREDLAKTYNYLTEVMGLEGSRSVLGSGSGSSRNAHENRHSTKLRLIASPAWRLPLRRTAARHSLLLFAGQWPPSLPRPVNKSRDQIVGHLLNCPPEEFSYWLEFRDGAPSSAENFRVPIFSGEDVRQFEKICGNLVSDDDVMGFEDEVGIDNDLDDEEYTEDESNNENPP